MITWVEVEHGVLGLLEQVLQADVLTGVAREREVGCHASDRRRCITQRCREKKVSIEGLILARQGFVRLIILVLVKGVP